MTIQLVKATYISGSVAAAGSQHTLATATEAYLVNIGVATWVGGAPDVTNLRPAFLETDASGDTVLVGADSFGDILITGGQYPTARVKVGTFGDSFADIATVASTTAQSIDNATSSTTPIVRNTQKIGAWFGFFSDGLVQPVFNGGVGGETTTQIATRVAAAESATSTSKSMLNAQLFGCDFLVVSMGINDFSSYTTGTSAATITAGIATAMANVKALVKKAKSLGIYVFFQSVLPYGSEGSVTANQAVVNTTTTEFNRQVAEYLAGTIGAEYYDARQYVQASDGGWVVAMTADGTHPNHAGCVRMYPNLIRAIKRRSGVGNYRNALPKAKNIFGNADLSASTDGLATGITVATVDGTSTKTIEVIDGTNVQQFIFAPGNVDGTGSAHTVDIELNAAGASPNVALSIGDILAVEYDLEIDDGSGGAPNIWSLNCYLRKNASTTPVPTIYNSILSPYSGASELYYQDALIGKVSGGHITIDEATSAATGKIFARIAMISKTQTVPIRVRISNIRCVKVASTY